MSGHCPDCWCPVDAKGSVCCDPCAEKRREALRNKEKLAMDVGRQSSSEEYELRNITGTGPIGFHSNEGCRNLPALRDDVHWYIHKHGAG